jgi:NADPH:quinone reductase-like Zn-dependent oxidoreductase
MRAVVHRRYGGPDVLGIEDVERPVPGDHDVLVRVHATTVNRTDCGFRKAEPFIVRPFSGLVRPRRRILGTELAGVVEAVGGAVTEFGPGDRVFGVNADRFGTHAEFVSMRAGAPLATMPAGVSFEEAAAVCDGGILALTCLRWARLQSGQDIMVYGASGAIGTAAVQLAKHFGAHVTAVCNTPNVATVGALGADRVVDYTREEFTATDDRYDVVFDAVGKTSFRRCRHLVRPGGRFVETDLGFMWQNVPLALLTWRLGRTRVLVPIPKYRKEEVLFLRELVEAGRFRPVIDRRYPLDEIVEATRYVETGQKTGNVVITVRGDG